MSDQPAQALLRVLNASITALPWTLQDAEDLLAELAAIGWHLEPDATDSVADGVS